MENQGLTISYASSGAADFVRHSAPSGASSSTAKGSVAPAGEVSLAKQGPVFVSPRGIVDSASGVYILQYRNHDTGEVKAQYPSKKVVEAYRGLSVPVPSPDEAKEQPSGSNVSAAPAAPAAPAAASNAGHSDTTA